jgi:hypothetical protein
VARIAICATKLCISMVHINMRHRKIHIYVAHMVCMCHIIMWSIFFMRHKNIFVEHLFLNAPQNPFLSISVFLVMMMSSTTSRLSPIVPSPTISRYARLPPSPTLFPLLFHTVYLVLPNLVEWYVRESSLNPYIFKIWLTFFSFALASSLLVSRIGYLSYRWVCIWSGYVLRPMCVYAGFVCMWGCAGVYGLYRIGDHGLHDEHVHRGYTSGSRDGWHDSK